MKPARVLFFALSLSLLLSGAALAQQDKNMGSGMGMGSGTTGTMMGAGMMGSGSGHGGMKALLDKNGKVTKDEFMDLAKQRAENAWKRLDPDGKGFVTKEDFDAKRQARKEKMMQKRQMPQ